MSTDFLPCLLFLAGIGTCLAADARLRRAGASSWSNGCITAVGARLVFVACAAAIG